MQNSKERVANFEWLRALCCFMIVLLHVSSSYWNSVPVSSREFTVMTAYNVITRFAVPVFMTLSGTFLLDYQKKETAKSLLGRIIRLLLCFYLWAVFYAFQGIVVKALRGVEIDSELWRKCCTW